MAATLTLTDVRRAWDTRDPELPQLVARLAEQPDAPSDQPVRAEAATFAKYQAELRSWKFKRKSDDEKYHVRVEGMKRLEADDAEVPLPDRFKLHSVIAELWVADDPFSRACLLDIIATVPLTYGPWRALKAIFKDAEARRDTEVYGALAARFDKEYAGHGVKGVSQPTLAYLVRRAWRFLRRVAVQLPATYADDAVDFLVRYPEGTNWRGTWIANHIFYHESDKYGRGHFQFGWREKRSPGDLKERAYPDLWKRSPRPLFTLLERARADAVREFATAALKADFRTALRDVEPVWVVRLVGVQSKAIDEFVIWLLQNVPKFEQGSFRQAGLHEAVLRLLDSPSDEARQYAADYARTHARDLPVPELVRLANNTNETVRKLAQDLLGELDPRKDVGLAAWGELLETQHGFKFAADAIPQHFGAKELTPDWFADRLLSTNQNAYNFAKELLPKVHTTANLGADYFVNVIRRLDPELRFHTTRTLPFLAGELGRFDLNAVAADGLKYLALFPNGWGPVARWVNEGKLKPQTLGADFGKALAYQPDWAADPWLGHFRAETGAWARDLPFDESRAQQVLAWLADPRKFTPSEVGFDWLMKLVARPEALYHDFAVDTLIKAFAPSDFAPQEQSPPVATGGLASATIDLQKATFVFTGKLASMTRDEAHAKAKAANGAVAGSVTKNLHYLVIGDEGSPLYGQGKKGTKQVKAEQLNEAGANIRIVSETMFLQMLAGQQRSASADATRVGCERLWDLAVAPGPADAPVAKFARQYIRRHHPALGQHLTDRPVDPGTEVPSEFLNWDRVSPLFAETRRPLREFALDLAKWEFARWNPNVDQLVWASELPFADVRRFVAKALLADDKPENRAFRLDPAKLEPAAAYRFCESADDETRALGMELIRRQPRLRVPEELFRLTESPDRKVRAFVIHSLWAVYRDRGVTPNWKPPLPPQATIGAKARQASDQLAANRGDGVPHRPETWPAGQPTLAEFLRRVLFELPPGRPSPTKGDADSESDTPMSSKSKPKTPTEPADGKVVATKPLPARRAKLDAVETMRDLALSERDFASGILPLLDEFLLSRGKSEQAACLVAVTRIRHAYPQLQEAAG